jgi:putative ABC transport system permease protein
VKFSLHLRLVRRESRGARGRIVFFVLSLAVGVAAVVAVAGLAAALDGAIREEARPLLGADVAVEGTRPIPPAVDEALASIPGLEQADVKEMATVVSVPRPEGEPPGPSQIVELKAVRGGYPFYGRIGLEPDEPLASLLGEDGVVAAPELLERLGIRVGDAIRVGGATFRVRGEVREEPGRLAVGFAIGPRLFVSFEGLERAGLERFGSRIEYRRLLRLPGDASAAAAREVKARLKEVLPERGGHRVETFADAQPALREGLERAERFLGLVALLSLLIGGIGVAQSVRAWISGRLDAIAVLRCLGLRPAETVSLYAVQTAALGLVGSAAGALAGTLALAALPAFLPPELQSRALQPVQPAAIARGLALGVGVALLFSLPPLDAVRRVPPLRVFRRDADPIPWGVPARVAAAGVLLTGVFATAWVQSGSGRLGAGFTAGLAVATVLLAAAAWGLTRAVARWPRRAARVWVRHGLAALTRPDSGTMGAVLALGVGVLVVLAMWIVQDRLGEQLEADLPADAPTAFFIDVQPDQLSAVRRILEESGATRFESVPMVTARLLEVDGRRVEDLAKEASGEGRERWVLTREQRLTYLERLPEDNVVVEGSLWSDPDRAEVSVERDFARDLGVGVGSTLVLDVQGVPVPLAVTSLRTVDWRTFGINFFLVAEPGVLEDAPQQRVAVARIPPGREDAAQNALAAGVPNVTMIRIREVLEKVVAVLTRVGLAVRLLGGFTVLAGVGILAGAVGATSSRRGREVALLKTLGMTRGGVMAVFSVEYALVGAVAGVIGSAGAGVLAWVVLSKGMEIPWRFDPGPYAFTMAGAVVLSVAAGLAASSRALRRRPVEVLRTAER